MKTGVQKSLAGVALVVAMLCGSLPAYAGYYLSDLALRVENEANQAYDSAIYEGSHSYNDDLAIQDLRRVVDDARGFRWELDQYPERPDYAQNEFRQLESTILQAQRSLGNAYFSYQVSSQFNEALSAFYQLRDEYQRRVYPPEPYPPAPYPPYPPRPYPPAPYPPAPYPPQPPRPNPPYPVPAPRPQPPRPDPRPAPYPGNPGHPGYPGGPGHGGPGGPGHGGPGRPGPFPR